MTATRLPQDIYAAALRDRESDDPLTKQQACEKGWLAVIEAVDSFLATKGRFIKEGEPDAHVQRVRALSDLAVQDPSLWKLSEKVSVVAENLHGACFYGGLDSPANDRYLKETVRDILEMTGHDLDPPSRRATTGSKKAIRRGT